MRSLNMRARTWTLALATGGSALALEGCNANVRDTVLGGVEAATTGLITTFIQAFFETLADEPEDVTTVWVQPAETDIFA